MTSPLRRTVGRLLATWRSRAARGTTTGRGEGGATLIFVLVFMLVGGLIVGGLADAAASDLGNSVSFKAARTLDDEAASETNLAIQQIRYQPLLTSQPTGTLNASPPVSCWGPSPATSPPAIDGLTVWCSTAWTPTSTDTRVVTLSTCASGESASSCAAHPLLQAVVTFDDYPSDLTSPAESACSTYCGTTMTIDRWVMEPVLPTVTGIRPSAEGNTGGGTLVTITGTGFVPGSTVDFVEESGGVPTEDNVVLPAESVSYLSPQSIAAVAPAVTAGTTYFVTVTTPAGSTPYVSSAVFTYTQTTPAVTGLSVASGGGESCSSVTGAPAGVEACGSIAGGTSVTITGTGFASDDTVDFVEDSGGAPDTAVTIPGTYVTVNSPTSITVVAPAISTGSDDLSTGWNYFVTVTTPGVGTSAYGPTFWYFPVVATVASITPTSGSAGTPVTLTGTGYFAGATVEFCEESDTGTCFDATGVTVSSATSITGDAPTLSGGAGTAFYVVVVTAEGGTSWTPSPIFTY